MIHPRYRPRLYAHPSVDEQTNIPGEHVPCDAMPRRVSTVVGDALDADLREAVERYGASEATWLRDAIVAKLVQDAGRERDREVDRRLTRIEKHLGLEESDSP